MPFVPLHPYWLIATIVTIATVLPYSIATTLLAVFLVFSDHLLFFLLLSVYV